MADEPDDQVTDDVGGVQGTEADGASAGLENPPTQITSDVPEQPAPDAGEIEWAGGLLKRPPAPQN
jgi:hypothetical protein